MDKVLIEGLRVNAVIGIFEWERQIEQPVLIDLVMTVDTRAAVGRFRGSRSAARRIPRAAP